MFQYFEKILPLVESLWCALQDEVYVKVRSYEKTVEIEAF